MSDRKITGVNLSAQKIETFCQSYIIHFCAKTAALDAGFSKSVAAKYGSMYLKVPRIQERLKELMGDKISKQNISKESVLDEIATLAFCNMAEYAKWGSEIKTITERSRDGSESTHEEDVPFVTPYDSSEVDARSVKSVSMTKYGLKIELHDKAAPLTLLAKYFKLVEGEVTDNSAWQEVISEAYRLGRQIGKTKAVNKAL
jgi:phage terminase small subunit